MRSFNDLLYGGIVLSGYVLSVIGTVLLCSVLTVLLPEGRTAAIIKAITRLVCVLTIVAPVLKFLQSKNSFLDGTQNSQGIFSETVIETDESFIKYYSEQRIAYAQAALEEELLQNFAANTDVIFTWQTVTDSYADKYPWEKLQITKIRIVNHEEQSEEVKQKMWNYVTENYCSEVQIE